MLEKQELKLLPLVAVGLAEGIFKYYIRDPLKDWVGELLVRKPEVWEEDYFNAQDSSVH